MERTFIFIFFKSQLALLRLHLLLFSLLLSVPVLLTSVVPQHCVTTSSVSLPAVPASLHSVLSRCKSQVPSSTRLQGLLRSSAGKPNELSSWHDSQSTFALPRWCCHLHQRLDGWPGGKCRCAYRGCWYWPKAGGTSLWFFFSLWFLISKGTQAMQNRRL